MVEFVAKGNGESSVEVKSAFVDGVFAYIDNGFGQKATRVRLRADDKLFLRFYNGTVKVNLDGNVENGILAKLTIEKESTLRSELEPLKASFGDQWKTGISSISLFLKPLIPSELAKRKALLNGSSQPVVEAQDGTDIDSLF